MATVARGRAAAPACAKTPSGGAVVDARAAADQSRAQEDAGAFADDVDAFFAALASERPSAVAAADPDAVLRAAPAAARSEELFSLAVAGNRYEHALNEIASYDKEAARLLNAWRARHARKMMSAAKHAKAVSAAHKAYARPRRNRDAAAAMFREGGSRRRRGMPRGYSEGTRRRDRTRHFRALVPRTDPRGSRYPRIRKRVVAETRPTRRASGLASGPRRRRLGVLGLSAQVPQSARRRRRPSRLGAGHERLGDRASGGDEEVVRG